MPLCGVVAAVRASYAPVVMRDDVTGAGSAATTTASAAGDVHDVQAGTLVFVYGTLLAGEDNHGHLAHARLVAETRTRPEFTLHDLGSYPGLVHGGVSAVAGELYEVDASTLAALDRLEDHPDVYRRVRIILENGAAAETYVLPPNRVVGHPVIAAASWRARHAAQRSAPHGTR